LAEGASLGTSSPRRQSAALALRPDLVCCAVRGSVERRVERLSDGAVDALLLAEAGLLRLLDAGHAPAAWQHLVAVRLEVDSWPTAPGQGALAVQVASASRWARHEAILALDDAPTRREVELERRVLERLGGGCLLPLGATVRAGTLFVALAEEGWRERACRGATPRVVSSSWRLAPAAELAAEPATEEVVAPADAELDRWIEELREEERHTAAQIPDAVPGTEAVPSLFVVDLAELAGSEGRTGAGEAIDLVVTSNRAATERTTVALARAARPPRRVASVEVLEAKTLEVEWPNLLELSGDLGSGGLGSGGLGTGGRRSRPWVLVSSPTAAEILVARSALEPEWLRLPWCALGPGTARTLLALGVPPNLVARSRNALELAAFAIAHLPSQAPLLIPQSRRAGADLVARLRAAGRLAVAWDAYTVEPRRGVRWPHPLAPEHVLFTSPSAVEAWETNALPWPERSAWAMGARTAASLATRYGGRVLVAEEPSAVGIAALWEQDRS
jgi:uroporphyrinogen-III synthase